MRKVKKIPFPSFRGIVAAPASAFGGEFNILVMGGDPASFERIGDDAVIDICGPLMQHGTFMFPSYDIIRANALAAFESDAKRVVLRIDSPGGDFAGCLELAKGLRASALSYGKPLVAFCDSMALSAGYAIACAASEIVITASAFVGSIGVWAALCDETARDAAQGLNIAIVASGARKADRNPHVPITEATIAGLQEEVDAMASLFFAAASSMRALPEASLRALEGAQVLGAEAVSKGLADRVVNSFEEFLATSGGTKMGMKELKAEHRAKLAKMAAEDSDDGKEAAAALAGIDEDDAKKAKKAEAEKEKEQASASASAEGDDKKDEDEKPAAKAEDDDSSDDGKKAAALAPSANELTLAARVHALEVERATEKLNAERTKLLASRPDFGAEARRTLARASLDIVRDAVKNWPRIVASPEATVAALTPAATRGDTQTSEPDHSGSFIGEETEAEYIARRMGQAQASTGVTRTRNAMTLGFMTHDQARKRLAELEAAQTEGSK